MSKCSWFLDTSDVYSSYILIHLISNTILLACGVFQLDLGLNHIDFNIFTLFIVVTIGISNLFIYCYFGKLATKSFEDMADRLYESNWHIYPFSLQKHLILMIGDMQIKLHYSGFGMAVLNLETFCAVSLFTFTHTLVW